MIARADDETPRLKQRLPKFSDLSGLLNESQRRIWAATESESLGYGGTAIVSAATGLSITTILKGRRELREAYVNVGCDHDTPAFAVASIRRWWMTMGHEAYPKAQELLIMGDGGGSNSHRARAWKAEIRKFADEFGLSVTVADFPPGTSKWNKIEHRLFCHITTNWRGRPLRTFESVVELIGSTRTKKGLRVTANLDEEQYPKGVRISDSEMNELQLHRNDFRGEWNYQLKKRQT